jgi:hypothetical protein
MSWLFSRLLLIAIQAVASFLVGRRGRLHLWHVVSVVLLTAVLLLPAVACARLLSRPDAWLSELRMHARGWSTRLVDLSLRFGLGVVLVRLGRRGHPPKLRPFATPTDA